MSFWALPKILYTNVKHNKISSNFFNNIKERRQWRDMSLVKTKILMVEDDKNMAMVVAELLSEAGYSVTHFPNANKAIEWLKDNKVDLIISDIGLPGISGMQFCKFLKENPLTACIPVIMLTAVSDELHKVECFKLGADDYIVKPFSSKEFIARIEALLRRYRYMGQTNRIMRSGSLIIDFDTGDVFLKEEKIELNPKEYTLLTVLIEKKGRILTYSFLAADVWGFESIVTRDTIKVPVHRLREKLGKYGSNIEAVPGQGYKWTKEE